MKDKYTGTIGAAMAGLALLVIAGELLWASWYRVGPAALGAAVDTYASEMLVVDLDAVGRMDLVEPTLSKLVQPTAVTVQSVIGSEP